MELPNEQSKPIVGNLILGVPQDEFNVNAGYNGAPPKDLEMHLRPATPAPPTKKEK
jgi:hypothetical protein